MVNLDYLYNPTDAVKNRFVKNFFVDKKLGFQVIEHGTILPYKKLIDGKPGRELWGFGGIVDKDGKFIEDSFVAEGAGSPYTPAPESIQYSSATVVYLGMFHSTWGHAITDNIKRLWFLKSEFMNQFKDCPLVYLICTKRVDFTLESYKDFRRLLEILEIDVDKLKLIEQPTQFENIILPDASFKGYKGQEFTKEYRETIERIKHFALKNRTPSGKKIYFYHGLRQVGEDRLAEYLKSKGYEIITPKQREADVESELNLLINADSFASPLGSSSINAFFLRDGVETIIIPRDTMILFDGYQMIANQINSLNANYIDSTLSVFNTRYSNYCYVISEQLNRFFGDKWTGYEEEEFKAFLSCAKNTMIRGRGFIPNLKDYFGDVFQNFMAQLKQHKDLIKAYGMPDDWETFRPLLTYQAHVHKKSWGDGWKIENKSSNPLDQELEILAIRLNYPSYKVYYSVYFNDQEGWSQEILAPEIAGTVGIHKPIYGMRVRLDEVGAKGFDILYRMHKFDGTWTPWAKNGENLYSYGQKLNAIQIKLEPVTIQLAQEVAEHPVEVQTFLIDNNEVINGQRQDLNQMYKRM